MAERLGGVHLTDEEARDAAVMFSIAVRELQRCYGSVPPAKAHLAAQFAEFARSPRSAGIREHANMADDAIAEDSPPMNPISVAEAAARMHRSPQAVRRYCRNGRLYAVLSPAGHWLIDADSLDLGVRP